MNDKDNSADLSPEDRYVWEEYTRDMRVEDISEDDFEALLDQHEGHSDAEMGANEVATHDEAPQRDEPILSNRKTPPPSKLKMSALSFEMDQRQFDRLRKGKISIEGRLDLHGMNQGEARAALIKFIIGSHALHHRCVLVITGKGKSKSTSDDWLKPSKGVLKENVPYWLSETPCKNIVLKYVHAIPKDGGSGALYIYLRRNK